jgi:hypothetical protein
LFNDKERDVAEGVVHRMVKRAVEMEGTVTGEHGVGLVKRDYLEHELGRETVDAMRKVRVSIETFRINAYLFTAETSLRSPLPAQLRQDRSNAKAQTW